MTPPEKPRPLVLVVEDDDLFAADLGAFLLRHGCEFERVRDGEEALVRLKQEPVPRLLLLDLLLPGMDGWHFYAETRRNKALQSVPIVVLTGAGRLAASELSGIVDFLRKPMGPATLEKFHQKLRAHLSTLVFAQ